MTPSRRLSEICRTHCAMWSRTLVCAVLFTWAITLLPAQNEARTPIRIDASQPFLEPGPAQYDESFGKSPSGSLIGINDRYLTLDGKPWLPVMGEFHFSRYPQSQWESEILKMKAAGVDIVATYVIWIHHEEVKGEFDWDGQRDLRAFAKLCAKHGMYLVARIGPWDHAEVRNGGLPDWVLQEGPTRVNDPIYLSNVRAWYGQVARQLDGLLWKDGGPVVGIQLENEYSQRGPGAGAEHILTLKKIALENKLDVPLYFVTGWDNAVVPAGAVIPWFGGYPDAPWDGSLVKLPPAEVYAFRFQNRVAANLTTPAIHGATEVAPSRQTPLPYFTAEMGGGNEITYHRRPIIQADDIAAMVPVMIGSGVNLYGIYMFHGGENPDGKLSPLQESQATGYPNDVPVKSYDFQAPLGEFGQERASFRKLKVFQYFLNDFGAELAPMMVYAPEKQPVSPDDLSTPRASVRSKGDAGFIFLNNYVRGHEMPARPAAQFKIRLPGGELQVPRHPVDIPSGAYFIWPFNFHFGDVSIHYATAQLFTHLSPDPGSDGVATLYFAAVAGIPAEFAFDAQGVANVKASSGETVTDSGVIYVSGIKPGVDSTIDITSSTGKKLRAVVLSPQEAENAWKVRMQGGEHLLISAQDFFADPDARSPSISLSSIGKPRFEFSVTPALSALPQASLPLVETGANTHATTFTAEAKAKSPSLEFHQIQPAGKVLPVKLGPSAAWRGHGVAQAPPESELPLAAKYSITVDPGSMEGLSELFLDVKYEGDVARLYSGHKLLTDDFYNGLPWSIGMERFLNPAGASKFELAVLPLHDKAPVYFETPEALDPPPDGQVEKLDGMTLVPEYKLVIEAGNQ